MADIRLRIAFLHLAPIPGALAKNRHLIAHAITKAACLGAAWIITPELAVGGYTFADTLGTDWIAPQPDPWMEKVRLFAARKRVAIFLSHPERDPQSGRLYNTVFAIAPDGRLAGSHRKINALRVGSEAWSTPGTETTVFPMEPLGNVGMLICADAFSPGIANSLKRKARRSWSRRRPGLLDCTARTASGNVAQKTPDCPSSCATAPEPIAPSISGRRTVWWLRTGGDSSRCPRNGLPFSSSTGI